MSTEVSGSANVVPTVEFLGSTFAERKEALWRVDSFRALVEQALLDSVTTFIDEKVTMIFRPTRLVRRAYPQYNNEHALHKENVTVRSVDDYSKSVVVSSGELVDGVYDVSYAVLLDDIVSIELIEPDA